MQKISEKDVAGIWRSVGLSHFTDDMGNSVEVICPGRAGTGPGCDFRDAVILVNSEKLVGDVELHLTSDLWHKHRHHVNPAYNGIILHVAMWQGGKLPVRLESGTAIPTVILSSYISENVLGRCRPGTNDPACPVIGTRTNTADVLRIVMSSGMQRFSVKSEKYMAELEAAGPGQALYKGICRALGYTRNTGPFEALADSVPLDYIMKNAGGSLVRKQSLLIGAAGMLPSQCKASRALLAPDKAFEIENEWKVIGERPSSMHAGAWNFSCLRPANHPLKRLLYLSHLLHIYEPEGLLKGITGLANTASAGVCCASLERGLMAREDINLIGQERVREIIVNQVLPFMLALAVKTGNTTLATQAVYVYLNFGALPANELSRYMLRHLKLKSALKLNACVQQGLLHIFHSFCRVKDCRLCPVSAIRRPNRG